MICADASALVAILLGEPLAEQCHHRIGQEDLVKVSIASAFEAALAIGKQKGDYQRAGEIVKRYLDVSGAQIVGVNENALGEIVLAYSRYGKGTGHPAHLNMGDCFSYALAKSLDAPLLFIGNDFRHTDLRSAI